MQATSRQTFAAVRDRLDAMVPDTSPEQLRQIADELLSVAGLLAGQPRLRRALSDPARPGEDRAGLLSGLVGGQVHERTRELLEPLVSGRWSTGGELLAGCEEIGVQALLASAERQGVLGEVEDELFRFGQVAAGDPALAAAIGDRSVPVDRRADLVSELLAGKATDVTVRAVTVALGGLGGRTVTGGLTRLVELAAGRRDRSVAYVTVATPLTETEEQRLGTALATRYGREISLKTTVDPRVIGGVRVQVGADLYDGTISRRLAQARTALVSG